MTVLGQLFDDFMKTAFLAIMNHFCQKWVKKNGAKSLESVRNIMYLATYPDGVDEVLRDTMLANFAKILDGAVQFTHGFPLSIHTLLLEGLPADIACSAAVEVFTIDKWDPRKPLHGKRGLRVAATAQALPAGTFIGMYRGKTMFQSAFRRWKLLPPPGTDVLDHELFVDSYAASAIHFNVGRWAATQGLDTFPGKSNTNEEDNAILVSAAGYGNETACVNDPHIHPLEDSEETLGANTCMCEIVIGAWPFLALFTLKEVKPGEELLYEYGKAFWDYIHEDLLRIQSVREATASGGVVQRLQRSVDGLRFLEHVRGRSVGYRRHIEAILDQGV